MGGDAREEVLFDVDRGWSQDAWDWSADVEELDDGWDAHETGVDGDEQENVKLADLDVPRRLLARLERSEARQQKLEGRKTAQRTTTKRRARPSLRVVAGKARGMRLVAAEDSTTRPMMENVREAVFDMLLSHESRHVADAAGGGMFLGKQLRWLDLYAGTGSVGIEAMSRGVVEGHFVEADAWCVSHVLQRNLTIAGCKDQGVVHTLTVEKFMENTRNNPRMAGGTFDFISVTPPYPEADFTALLDMLESSPLVHSETVLVIEYPKKAKDQMREMCGPLIKFRDRKYGRTRVAIYGPL